VSDADLCLVTVPNGAQPNRAAWGDARSGFQLCETPKKETAEKGNPVGSAICQGLPAETIRPDNVDKIST